MSWDSYFSACAENDLMKAFDAFVELGMRPVPIGEDSNTGAIKIPIGKGWGNEDIPSRRDKLKGYLEQDVPIGIGCQADGYIVLDIDPPGKDRSKLPSAWKESAAILLGGEDWPDTLITATQGGCHVWFKITPKIRQLWVDRGKLELPLPSGGKIEFFTGNSKQMQVACAPSPGKKIAKQHEPADLPYAAEQVVLDLIKDEAEPRPAQPISQAPHQKVEGDEDWFMQRLLHLTANTVNAEVGDRHGVYRGAVRVMAGYAAGMGLEHLQEQVYIQLTSAHREAKPEVSNYVLVETFKWAWTKGIERPLTRMASDKADPLTVASTPKSEEFFESIEDAANAADIRAKMKERNWLWGNKEENVGWFMQGGLHLVEGKEGTGKTRYLLELERRKSLDLTWPDGSKILAEPDSKILFVASDSHWDQIAVTSEAFGIPDENVIFTGPKSDPYNFTSIDDANTIAMIRHWCQRYSVSMVVVDTLMAASTRPLVDPQEVAQMLRPLRDLAREMNVVVVLVGHLNSQGETWGRAVGRMCDNVIRMEADERDEQLITIKSVKARWNRFKLPTLRGRQGETGWEFSSPQSENGVELGTPSDRAADAILAYVRSYPDMTKSNVIEAVMEKGHSKTTAYRVFDQLVMDGRIIGYEKETFSGKTIRVFDVQRD